MESDILHFYPATSSGKNAKNSSKKRLVPSFWWGWSTSKSKRTTSLNSKK